MRIKTQKARKVAIKTKRKISLIKIIGKITTKNSIKNSKNKNKNKFKPIISIKINKQKLYRKNRKNRKGRKKDKST